MTALTEDLARTLHDEQCAFPWDTGTDAHKDEWRQRAVRYLQTVKTQGGANAHTRVARVEDGEQ